MTSGDARSSAVGPALGYLYQFRYGLFESLERVRRNPEVVIAFELIDDVTFETSATTERMQIKHHTNPGDTLSDASPDLWRTLEIWIIEGVANSKRDVRVYLATTSDIPEMSAGHYLGPGDRNVDEALKALTEVARTSSNKKNLSAYRAFLDLTPQEQSRLLDRMVVLGQTPPISDIDEELRNAVRWSSAPEHVQPFLERLEGWWIGRCIDQLSLGESAKIQGLEIDEKIHDLRESFRRDNLPIDDEIFDLEADPSFDDRVFVRQLGLIEIGGKRLAAAVRDYLRAFTQRSRWMRDDLLNVGELGKYERRLYEAWEVRFEAMRDRLGEQASNEAAIAAAQDLYEWVEQDANLPIREMCREGFITRGSYQMLADEYRVGWHPSFGEMLSALLGGESSD